MASTLLATARQRCLVVLLTDLNSTALELGLMPRVDLLASRYQLLVAATADPRLTELSLARDDAMAVYQAAAAERAREERAKVAALLTQRGVDVVDAPPGQLAPALADAYLRLKARGRL
jgi:uncharacterized protein (DUF58 family)